MHVLEGDYYYTIFFYTSKKLLQYFDCLPLKINTFMSSFNNENDQCIAAHLFCFYIKKLIQYFDCLTLKINTFYVVTQQRT